MENYSLKERNQKSRITLDLDKLFNNCISPETIAEEVRKASAEYFAEVEAKKKAEMERESRMNMAREDAIDAIATWISVTKDKELTLEEKSLIEKKLRMAETKRNIDDLDKMLNSLFTYMM